MPGTSAIPRLVSATQQDAGDHDAPRETLSLSAIEQLAGGDLVTWEAPDKPPLPAGGRPSRRRVPWLSRGSDRARLEALNRQQEAIAAIGRQVASGIGADGDRMLGECVDLVARTLDVDACAILEFLPKDGRFFVRAASGLSPEARRCTLVDSTNSLAGRALRADGPLFLGPGAVRGGQGVQSANGARLEEVILFKLAVRSALLVKIGGHDAGQPFGVLAGYRVHEDPAFTRDDVFFMQFIADTAAGSLERAQQAAAALRGEARYRRIVAHIPGMVYQLRLRVDGTFSFPFVTEGCRGLFGFEPQAIYDDPLKILNVLYEDDRDTLLPAIRASAQSLAPLAWTGRYFTQAGETRWLRTDSRPEKQLSGDVLWDGLMFDISELKRAQQATVLAKNDAEKANHAKSDFLSRISHELRTPLNAILGFSQFLQRQHALQGVYDDCLAQIAKAGSHLLGLINQVLDISRIESGTVKIVAEPVSVGPVISEIFALLRGEAEERAVTLMLERPAQARRLRVMADSQRFKQVLLNVLSNAVKYNRNGGGVRVACAPIEEETSETRQIEIAVSDDGPGIARENLGRLFVPFDRLGAESTSIPGTGLGLALSKSLVEALGGTITVESEPEHGATFRIRLPSDDPRAVQSGTPPPAARDFDDGAPAPGPVFLTPRRVLYVEDSESNRMLLERLLGGFRNLSLRTASTGTEGLAILRDEPIPDLVLIDLHLPDLPGEEILRELRRSTNENVRRLPIVVMSADATATSMERLRGLGANAYLTKPLDLSRLLETLHAQMERRATDTAPDAGG